MAFHRVQPWRDTAANWTAINPVLRAGEVGYETDTGETKRGDGATPWTELAYVLSAGNAPASYPRRVEPSSYTYNPDGTVATETAGGLTTSYTYNPDGSIDTITRDGTTLTVSYNVDGTVSGVA